MIAASVDAQRSREAAISGTYQYDTGQRIRMYGLPAPDELSQMDDFLSGDAVTVEVQFSFMQDAQSGCLCRNSLRALRHLLSYPRSFALSRAYSA